MTEQIVLDCLTKLGQPEHLLELKTRLDVRLVDFDFIAGAKHLLHGAPLLTRADIAARVRTEVHLLQRYLPPFEEVGLIKALATRYFKRQLDYCDDLCRELSEPMSRCADFSLAALADVLDLADIASQNTRNRMQKLTDLLRRCHALAQIRLVPDRFGELFKLTYEAAQHLLLGLLDQKDCRATIDGLLTRIGSMFAIMRKRAAEAIGFSNVRIGFAAIDFFVQTRSHFRSVFSNCLVAAAKLDAADSAPAFAEKFSPKLRPTVKTFLCGKATDAQLSALFAELMV